MMQQKIYAVLVGIDQYQKYPLSGCVNDIKAVEQWLTKTYSDGGQAEVLRLTDDDPDHQPVRQNIIDAFNLFDKATGDDICLFYYSGHGINIKPPAEFSYEPALQAFVCKDWAGVDDGTGFLIDKELSYLIWEKTRNKPDLSFVLVTDCCHSGTITRDITDETEPGVRAIAGTFQSPPVTGFLGYTDDAANEGYRQEKNFDGSSRLVVSSGRYLHFAAAQDDQKAYEITTPDNNRRGGFTYYLIDILQKFGGQATYQEVFDYIGRSLRQYFIGAGKTKQQFPCFSASDTAKNETIGDRIFFTKNLKKAKRSFDLYFDPRENSKGWYVNGGQLDGLSAGDVFELELPADGSPPLTVTTLFRDYAFVSDDDSVLDKAQRYSVRVMKPLQSALLLSFDQSCPAALQQQVMAAWERNVGNDPLRNVAFDSGADTPPAAPVIKLDGRDLYLYFKDNRFRLCEDLAPFDANHEVIKDSTQLSLVIDNLAKATAWVRLVLFRNQAMAETEALPYRLLLKCTTGAAGNGDLLFADRDPKSRQIMKYLSAEVPPAFQLAVANTFTDTLFVSFAYLAADGSIDTNVFNWLTIEAGKTATMTHDDISIIPLTYEPDKDDNNEFCTEYLKIFIGKTGLISLDAFDQKPLERQYDGTSRALGFKPPDSSLQNFDWQAETVCFSIQRKPSLAGSVNR